MIGLARLYFEGTNLSKKSLIAFFDSPLHYDKYVMMLIYVQDIDVHISIST